MGLDSLVRNAVATANRLTAALQVTVTHEAWTGKDSYNKPTYASGKDRQCILEWTSDTGRPALVKTASGEEKVVRAKLTFVVPIAANGADDRQEPVDPRDIFTLPDGTTGPILNIGGVVDPSTSAPYALEVSIG